MGKQKTLVQAGAVYQLKLSLRYVEPPVWRRLLVRGDATLSKLSRIIQIAMGWEDEHLHCFNFGNMKFGVPDRDFPQLRLVDERRPTLDQLALEKGKKFQYEYDFGDGWLHEIKVEKISEPDATKGLAVCLGGERACPPEDCGGPGGYEDLLEAIKDENHECHEDMIDTFGEDFDAEAFDLESVNAELRRLK